ncbi:hypothetical protein CFC21_055047 [Triticum aestivum]|uniref:Subtilisin-like protease n=2 Tax=Triticum aestivum TaxID=4565 RepID=A0A9R1GEE3_WHEAT|nr:subtilisin-like protease 4 [Triticum aestivum]KAF7045987.1 hypothetical protein CFC21_055047 [Triticum aestivum]
MPIIAYVLLPFFSLLCSSALPLPLHPAQPTSQPQHVYIVHTIGVQPYHTLLPVAASNRVIHEYSTVLTGFACRMTAEEARHMSGLPGVRAVYQSRVLHTQTTRSPAFLGLQEESGAWPESDFGDGVIIGLVDTGITPAHPSFHDAGLGPVRSSWKGRCVQGHGFDDSSCNNKLVGARAFLDELVDGERDFTPVDRDGHGTHVAATAAGSPVPGANLLNFSRGDATGTAPKAKIAIYKVCYRSPGGCPDWAIVAAVDAAVSDGVDIISMSLGAGPTPFYDDVVAVATFGAVRAGVFVVLAGGNAGPNASTVSNAAPWMTTVGAATLDRVFPATLKLGNRVELTGQSLYNIKSQGTTAIGLIGSTCDTDDLTPDRVMGKVVVCSGMAGAYTGRYVQRAGGAGMVSTEAIERWGEAVMAEPFGLPGLKLSYTAGKTLESYISSTAYPVASFIFRCDTVTGSGASRAPLVAGFSSRGPSQFNPEIIKPDVIAPGVNILAAWNQKPEGGTEEDYYLNIISGTSMACPHVVGVAALIKKQHGDWTPAMIRSSLMTTATMLDNRKLPIVDSGNDVEATPLVAGAGMVVPTLAMDPGLVYDAGAQDYIDFLCSVGYTAAQIRRFEPGFVKCTSTAATPGGAANLNYPSMVVMFDGGVVMRRVRRTLTAVSQQEELYEVTVTAPDGVAVTVTPRQLHFSQYMEKKTYILDFKLNTEAVKPAGTWEFAEIAWKSKHHHVRSPVAFGY